MVCEPAHVASCALRNMDDVLTKSTARDRIPDTPNTHVAPSFHLSEAWRGTRAFDPTLQESLPDRVKRRVQCRCKKQKILGSGVGRIYG